MASEKNLDVTLTFVAVYRAARVGNRVVVGMGGGPSCAPGIPTAAGKAPGAWQGRGGAGRGLEKG